LREALAGLLHHLGALGGVPLGRRGRGGQDGAVGRQGRGGQNGTFGGGPPLGRRWRGGRDDLDGRRLRAGDGLWLDGLRLDRLGLRERFGRVEFAGGRAASRPPDFPQQQQPGEQTVAQREGK